jgi:hypothetical protein
MKKNLQKILVLALGLTTTIASAQFSANSVSRIDNTDSDNRSIKNRIAISADYGAVHVSSDVSANTDGTAASYAIYEAYASTDLMGFGTLTVGRQDLSFGSGALLSGNDWGLNRYTEDGISFSMNLGGFDVNLGSLGGVQYDASNYMNASGNFGGADVNILMMNDGDNKAHGYDVSYAMNNFTVTASMNSDYDGDEMTSYGLTYNVTDDLSATFGRTSYGDAVDNDGVISTGFDMSNTAMSGDNTNGEAWANGVLGYLGSNDENTSMGVSYDLGDITLSYTMHTISNDNTWDGTGTEPFAGAVMGDDSTPDDREATSMSLSYQLNDNCSISLSRFSDSSLEADAVAETAPGAGDGTDADDGERTWLTISIEL